MNGIFPSASSLSSPDFSAIDGYLKQQASLKGFFDNSTGTQIVTLGFPQWLDISSSADQTRYANMVLKVAQHFASMGEPIDDFELVNEPDQPTPGDNVTDLADLFTVVAKTLEAANPNYKLGGLTESYMIPSDLRN